MGLIVLLASGCTGGSPAPAQSPSSNGTPSGTSTATATSEPFDCPAVSAAQQALHDASAQELSRLDIDRSDPRAFTVTLVVASQQAAEYWRAVESAATDALDEDQRRDLQLVTGYWGAIDAELDAIEIADSSDAAVQQAADELSDVSNRHPQADLAAAQQRLQDVLAAMCGIEPAPAPSTST